MLSLFHRSVYICVCVWEWGAVQPVSCAKFVSQVEFALFSLFYYTIATELELKTLPTEDTCFLSTVKK